MNKQPCFRSTKHHDRIPGLKRKECAQDLVNFYNLHCLSHGITFTINICQLYKVDMHPSLSFEKDIQNGKQGMGRMIAAGIELKAMSEESWGRLASYADIELPEYQDSNRQKLDRHIDEFIQGPSDLTTRTRVSTSARIKFQISHILRTIAPCHCLPADKLTLET